MNIKLAVAILLFVFQIGYSQTEQLLKGRVFCEDYTLNGIEVLNLTSKRIANTDSNGNFFILAKAKDSLMFVSKLYEYKKISLNKEDLEKVNLTISLTRKPEQLEEIVIISKINFPKIKFDKNIASQLTIEKAAKNPKPYGVYDGTIENGMGMIINLPSGRKKIHEIEFKKLMKKSYNDSFYIEILKLKPEEIGLFIEFCAADPKSKTVLKNSNPLKSMDFLMSKKNEFEKILTSENK